VIVIDTDIAVHWRDGDPGVGSLLASLPMLPAISVLTQVELENGVYRDPTQTERRRTRVDNLLARLTVLAFTRETAAMFSQIVARHGFSRGRTIDRMIAATVLLHDATLVTMNGQDYRDIPNLKLTVWPSPA